MVANPHAKSGARCSTAAGGRYEQGAEMSKSQLTVVCCMMHTRRIRPSAFSCWQSGGASSAGSDRQRRVPLCRNRSVPPTIHCAVAAQSFSEPVGKQDPPSPSARFKNPDFSGNFCWQAKAVRGVFEATLHRPEHAWFEKEQPHGRPRPGFCQAKILAICAKTAGTNSIGVLCLDGRRWGRVLIRSEVRPGAWSRLGDADPPARDPAPISRCAGPKWV
jgi:hypothetical protein